MAFTSLSGLNCFGCLGNWLGNLNAGLNVVISGSEFRLLLSTSPPIRFSAAVFFTLGFAQFIRSYFYFITVLQSRKIIIIYSQNGTFETNIS